MNQHLRAGLYCRISKEDEVRHETSVSIETQRKKLTDFALQSNIHVFSTYCDDGVSGTTFNRPSFKKMIEDIEKRRINCVIVKDLSRLGREYIQSGDLLENFFPKHNTRFIALDDNIDCDPSNPTQQSNMMIPFFNLMNEFYPSDISKKTRSALCTKAHHGEYLGARAPYGYKKMSTNKNKLAIDETSSHWVRFIYEKTIAGWSLTQLTKELHKLGIPTATDLLRGEHNYQWTSATIKAILINPVYLGKTVYGKSHNYSYKNKTICRVPEEKWIIVDNMHPAIINQELFDEVQHTLKFMGRTCSVLTAHPFAGKLYCSDCGSLLNFCREPRKSNMDEGYYVCRANKRFGNEECSRHYIRLSVLSERVVNELAQFTALVRADKSNLYQFILNKNEMAQHRISAAVSTRLEQISKRQDEINCIFVSLYEDKALGRIGMDSFTLIQDKLNAECATMTEQSCKDKELLNQLTFKLSGMDAFISLLTKCDLTQKIFDADVVERFIEKIVVENRCTCFGKPVQYIQIFYKHIGCIEKIDVLEQT